MRKETRQKLESLKSDDIYSMMLFALYKLKDNPKYSTLVALPYILNRDSLLNFLDCFGGLTITIPTREELNVVINALLLYQFVNLENIEFNEAFKLLDKEYRTKEVKNCYYSIIEILENHDFNNSGETNEG